jgi:RecA-family ATPase
MAKSKRQKTSMKKSRRRSARGEVVLIVEVEESRSDILDLEKAIRDKLRTQPTDLFKTNDKVVIECEKEGPWRDPGGK